MTKNEAAAALKSLLRESGKKFASEDLVGFLNTALADLGRVKPRVMVGELTLIADQPFYLPPADLVRPLYSNWGRAELMGNRPWNSDWPGRLPRLGLVVRSGSRLLELDPAPVQTQITLMGAAYGYHYQAGYALGDQEAQTTLPAAFDQLLLVRALSAVMLSLALGGVTKPVELGKAGIGGLPKNGAPAYLADELLDLFERMAA